MSLQNYHCLNCNNYVILVWTLYSGGFRGARKGGGALPFSLHKGGGSLPFSLDKGGATFFGTLGLIFFHP